MSTEKSLDNKTKKELIALVLDYEKKLDTLKDVEKVVTTQTLPNTGLSVIRDKNDKFYLVHLNFNVDTGAASVLKLEDLHSTSEAIAMYQAKKFLVENVVLPKQYSYKGE